MAHPPLQVSCTYMPCLLCTLLLIDCGSTLCGLLVATRINDFNVDDLVRAILPYHETPQFAQMLQILKLE